MALTPLERTIYLGAPWVFGVVLTLSGIIATAASLVASSKVPNPTDLQRVTLAISHLPGIALVCSGLICTSLFCLCSILLKSRDDKS